VQFYRRSPNPGWTGSNTIRASYDCEYQNWKTIRMEEEWDINQFHYIISCSINGHFLPVTHGTTALTHIHNVFGVIDI
jgi:hypothetical protein